MHILNFRREPYPTPLLSVTMDRSAKDPAKISSMFSNIAHRYDLLNRTLSLGIDGRWRKFAVNQLPRTENASYLDAATGTCDVALEIIKIIPGSRVTGVDFSEGMLEQGRKKIDASGFADRIDIRFGDAADLPFDDGTFDGAIIAFGIRNVQDFQKGISEMARVVRPGGRVVILEFTTVQNRLFRPLYRFYIARALPAIGELVSGRKGAYQYLPASVLDFPVPEALKKVMEEAGLRDVIYHRLTLGIVAVHVGTVS